jgi:hypothetical protein
LAETTPPRSRRTILIGGGLIVLLVIVAVVLLTANDEAPVRGSGAPPTAETPTDGEVAETPEFAFTDDSRKMIRTGSGRVKRRQRMSSERAARAARTVLDDLYIEGFLDPANWEQGSYADAFRGFAGGARDQAETQVDLLTAGEGAGDRYERILPVSGRLDTRILLDRSGNPSLILGVVRFSAAADGSDPATLRSRGQFFFERVGGSWKIVSFHVTRADVPREAA